MKTSNRSVSVLRRISANMLRGRHCPLQFTVLCWYLSFSFWTSKALADCWYNNAIYTEGTKVLTPEPCLNCTCSKGALLCYLRVCPALPNPPPPGCILLHKYKTCCPELICADIFESGNALEARSDPDEPDLSENERNGENACVVNGSVYGPGSAMGSSSLCEYCYCLKGKEVCVKPKCLLPIEGCVPMYETTSCCPMHYKCDYAIGITSSTTTVKSKETGVTQEGCIVDSVYYNEGGKVLGVGHSACDNCYCLGGILRCEPLSCAPALFGCLPVVRPGECCAASYNCSGAIEIQAEPNYAELPIVSKEYAKLHREVQKKLLDPAINRYTVTEISNVPVYVLPEPLQTTTKIQRSPGLFGTTRHFGGSSVSSSTTAPFFNFDNNTLETDERLRIAEDDLETTEFLTTTDDTRTTESITSTETTAETITESTYPSAETTSYLVTLRTVLNCTDCTDPEKLTTVSIDDENKIEKLSTTEHLKETTSRSTSFTPLEVEAIFNVTKIKDTDYEYDYNEPTLPPSLPNLRIIPFVAADALDLENERHPPLAPTQERDSDSSSIVTYNLFSPPKETEGGFIPKQPPIILDNLYENTLTSSSTTPESHETFCVTEEFELGHGQSIALQCKTCTCFYGNIVCQKSVCPPPKNNCRASTVHDSNLCCPRYICEDEAPTTNPPLSIDRVLQLLLFNNSNFTEDNDTLTTRGQEDLQVTTESDSKPNSQDVAILKLAGCNIYGRMYRVGRIISELSNPCLECKCTETGVQCRALKC